MRKLRRIYLHFVNRRKEYINNQAFMILLSIMVGVLAALAALFLKTLIHFIEYEALSRLPGYFFFLFPAIGIFIVVLLYDRIFRRASGFHGIPGVLNAIRKRSSFIHYSLMYVQMITGAITIGLGGSSGLESPTVVTGSAIGSNISRFFRLDYKFKTLFIGCGTAATIAAIFNAPVAGVIFATEVILPQFSATIFIPILISSATGAFFSDLFLGDDILFHVRGVTEFPLREIPLIMVLGFFCGLISLYFTKVFLITKILFQQVRNKWKRALTGSLMLGTIIFLFPSLFGEGYIGITRVINYKSEFILKNSILGGISESEYMMILIFGLLIILKPIASCITVHSGGEGGQFAPSFVTGGFAGYFFYLVAIAVLPYSETINPINYTLLGMAAVLAGVMHAPLTAIFLIAEITESYEMFIGLMLVTAISFFTKYYFDKITIHFQGTRGVNHDVDKHEFISLNNIRTATLIEREIIRLNEDDKVSLLIDHYVKSGKNVFAVIDSKGEFTGMITNHQLKKLLKDTEEKRSWPVRSIMTEPVATVDPNEQLDLVVRKFDLYQVDYFPVLRKNKLIGFISRVSVLASFRDALRKSNEFLND